MPGEPYSQEKLNELQSQLQDSGYFRSVFATIEVDPATAQAVPVRLDLTENERKRLSLGVGFSTNSGEISARFVVKRGGEMRFDKVKQIHHQWESSFAGAVAIPLAMNNYPVMVHMLIGQLITDPDFIRALRK